VDTFNLGVLEIGPVWVLESKAMAEVVKLQPHVVVCVALELNSANFDHQANLLYAPETRRFLQSNCQGGSSHLSRMMMHTHRYAVNNIVTMRLTCIVLRDTNDCRK
jgi:hypothetical protein